MTTRTTGSFTFADWQESVVAGDEGGPRLAHAVVTNAFTGGIEAQGTRCVYAISYADDATGVFTGYETCTGTVDGRQGSFVLREWGTFDKEGTHCSFEVLPGSGTDGLAGLRGTGGFTAVHGTKSIPYAFDVEWA
ncbi:DUF3224 domain-containing protein [Streptomyces litchfieldiae]|uniref:DUF3224 domain-containing protein n=1 Tax=Streptomyces litchfieldiae TaxID=3075543 RepID=A0ABU2MQV7_9ACTN|nr:DUF3224 domain-containing protein [Streptomyces sp. DSM 44938]MDT0343861.1 DUF3224 domain-containing protein [Streptomyces sp. DSM 44938]